MKPKTIEEYAEIYRCPATNENEYCKHDIISAINFGIELQKKISYNEEEVKELLKMYRNSIVEVNPVDIIYLDKWFEQFKK